jgi:hypothetical protein
MIRIASLAVLLAACSSAPRPIKNTSDTPTRYTLAPLHLRGNEGMHSASHSSTTVAGTLEMIQTKATLRLDMTHSTSFVHCPAEWQAAYSMQACAPPDAKEETSTHSLALTGDTRLENGRLVISVREDDQAATLTCDQKGKTLACTIDDEYTLFGRVGQRPDTLVFHL